MQKRNVPIGSDVSAGTYKCENCGQTYSSQSKSSMPPCSNCHNNGRDNPNPSKRGWDILSGVGDAKDDPYPG